MPVDRSLSPRFILSLRLSSYVFLLSACPSSRFFAANIPLLVVPKLFAKASCCLRVDALIALGIALASLVSRSSSISLASNLCISSSSVSVIPVSGTTFSAAGLGVVLVPSFKGMSNTSGIVAAAAIP